MGPLCSVGDSVVIIEGNVGVDLEGVIRFCGKTEFAPGQSWVGIELKEPKGNSDGSKCGLQYFNCQENFGVFCLSSQIRFAENVLNFKIGDRVSVTSRGYHGTIKYIGKLKNRIGTFADGIFVGFQLDLPNGISDGTYLEKRYFTCPQRHGGFAPISKCRRINPDPR